MLASADPAQGRKFLRALCCLRDGAGRFVIDGDLVYLRWCSSRRRTMMLGFLARML